MQCDHSILYPLAFQELLTCDFGIQNYVGQGNPSAKILIIGNECTAPEPHYTFETKQNFAKWQKHCANNDHFDDVQNNEAFDPLWPWKSWVYGGNFKAEGRNSSRTWNAYQQLINYLLPEDQRALKGQPYNLWQHCFITELSMNNMPHSPNKRIEKTAESINARLLFEDGILRHEFFQNFPIIILGCYHYKDIYDIDIEKCFRQKYIDTPYDVKHGKMAEFIHRHIRIDKDTTPHLLLHTNHFCMRSNDFIYAVGNECKNFLGEYAISI